MLILTYICMSLRAASNVSAGRHWPAGRTLRTNDLGGHAHLLVNSLHVFLNPPTPAFRVALWT